MVKQTIEKIYSAILAILGNILTVDKEQAHQLFEELNSMLFYIATIVCVPLVLAINSFIEIWYENMIETSWLIAFAFTGILFLAVVKISITVFVNAAGLFEQTKKCAITDTIVNLTLSFVLVRFFGIAGVLLATCVAVFVAEYVMKTVVIYKEIFERSCVPYFVRNLKFWALAVVDVIVGYKVLSYVTLSNIFMWFLVFAIYTIINGALILLVYRLFGETEFIKRFGNIFKRKGAKNGN
jgi:O-antigen/teichoic acid export membrane protein